MKNILQKYVALIWIVTCVAFHSCGTTKKINETAEQKTQLTESQRIDFEYILTEATKQKLFGNFKQAVSLYEKCIQVNKDADIAYYQIGNILLMTGNYKNAIEFSKKAVELDNHNFWYRIQLAQLYMIESEKDSALAEYLKIQEEWPGKVEITYEIARIYAEKEEFEKALRILNKIERENGISEPVSILKQQIYVQDKKPDLAIQELLKLIEFMPDEIKYLGLLAELYTDVGRNEDARRVYKEIFNKDPENTLALLSYSEFLKNTGEKEEQFIVLNNIFLDMDVPVDQKLQVLISDLTDEKTFKEDNDRIGKLIQILLELYPENYRVRTAFADYLVKNNKTEEALKEYSWVLSVEKGNYFIWEQVLFLENILEHDDRVFQLSDEALQIFNDRPVLYLFKGDVLIKRGNYEEAVKTLEDGLKKVINNGPLEVQFYTLLADAYRNKGNHDKSDACYEKALQLEPENLVLLNNYSYFLSLRKKQLEQAEKMSRKVILAEPENATYLDTYAWILYNKGNYKRALEYIQKAIEFNGAEDPDILEHYGDILLENGNTAEAVKYWKLAIQKGNESERINNKIEKVEK